MPSRIEDYALIGDLQTAALVSLSGSVDWMCVPRFDSGACFAALLGTPDHGRWLVAPIGDVTRSRRQYIDHTLVLETQHETAEGVVVVTDFMPLRGVAPDIVRIVEGKRGRVRMQSELVIRFDYGSVVPWVRKIANGIHAIAGPDTLWLHSPIEHHGENLKTVAEFTVEPGQRVPLTLTWAHSYQRRPKVDDPEDVLAKTVKFWSDWAGRCTYNGPWRDAVIRSLVTLKALTYQPTGGIVAAPTTSLPEQIGGVRNWDYRFCWLRDATLTLMALLHCGYQEEAASWREWLLRAVAGDPATVQIMYGLAGERRLTEFELDWLPGYENSKPVRVGNAASRQFQLDVYGEMMDALSFARLSGVKPRDGVDGWNVGKRLLKTVEDLWAEPDEGIWEVRGPRQHFVHSKVMAWVAIDRGIKLAEKLGLEAPLDRWRTVRDQIHATVCEKGFDAGLGAFVQAFGSQLLDASVLNIPLVGFLPPDDPRVLGTIAAIEKHLLRDGFMNRYDSTKVDDGLPSGEGTFLPCTFWYADNLALTGRRDEAVAVFERMLNLRNDVGLLAEEYDTRLGRQVGNFPQAFSHLGLVNTALNLAQPDDCPSKRRRAFSMVELLVVVAIIAILIGLILPAVQRVRETAKRSQCKGRLAQLGLACHNYHATNKSLPSGYLSGITAAGVETGPGWGWAAAILPQVEEDALYAMIQRTKPIEDPANAAVRIKPLRWFLCPSNNAPPTWITSKTGDTSNLICDVAAANYVGNFGSDDSGDTGDGVFYRNSRIRFTDIGDGASVTMLIGERTFAVGPATWVGSVTGATIVDPSTKLQVPGSAMCLATAGPGGVGPSGPGVGVNSMHSGGANVVFCDGHVAFLPASLDVALFKALATRAAGDTPPSGY
jgi:prepilin-type processing-associated H-X9-DG protein/prepilin-type N-terminal cleavage/methylation domain-containing protein